MSAGKRPTCSSSSEELVTAAKKLKTDEFRIPTWEEFVATCLPQQFSLPMPIMKYIWENPCSPEVYEKLIKCCKLFFIKNPIMIVNRLSCFYDKDGQWELRNHDMPETTTIDINNSAKVWALEYLNIGSEKDNFTLNLHELSQRLFKCDAHRMMLFNVSCSIADLAKVGAKCEKFWFLQNCTITENGNVTSLEKLLKSLPRIKNFMWQFGKDMTKMINAKTVAELIKLPKFQQFEDFYIACVPQMFDIETFYGYMKQCNNTTCVTLRFDDEVNDVYKAKLQTIIDEIRDTGIGEKLRIHYAGMPVEDKIRLFGH